MVRTAAVEARSCCHLERALQAGMGAREFGERNAREGGLPRLLHRSDTGRGSKRMRHDAAASSDDAVGGAETRMWRRRLQRALCGREHRHDSARLVWKYGRETGTG